MYLFISHANIAIWLGVFFGQIRMTHSMKKIFDYYQKIISRYEIQCVAVPVSELQLFLYECIMYFYNLDAHLNSIVRKNVTIATIHQK